MKPGLSLHVSQHYALTPQIQQSIRLLQLTTLELASEIEQMLADNPFLERDEDASELESFGLPSADMPVSKGDQINELPEFSEDENNTESSVEAASDVSWDGDGTVDSPDPNDIEWGSDATARMSSTANNDDEIEDAIERAAAPQSLADHLMSQAAMLHLFNEDAAALHYLIGNLDENGYLSDSIMQLAARFIEDDDDEEQIQELAARFTLALRMLQSLQPAGVGARNLAECLALQARRKIDEGAAGKKVLALRTVLLICERKDALDWVARRDVKRIANQVHCTETQARDALDAIAELDPKPGRAFVQVDNFVIIPDVIVSNNGPNANPRLRVVLNSDATPRLHVQEFYAQALRSSRDTRGSSKHQALATQLQEARWFVHNIAQRLDTILRVARLIVERQQGFFIHGELAMQPLVQSELADALGVHPSTISRVTTGKYMATPRGIFEFKYFFGSAVSTETGGQASSTAVRAIIKQLIATEDTAKPISDQCIVHLLKAQGIECARRTVAKYRENLQIPAANLRKTKTANKPADKSVDSALALT
jgi:RNA polymerase sigma-54 factor